MPAPPNMVKKALDTWENSPPSPEIDTSIGDPYNNPYTRDYLPPEEEQIQKQAAFAKAITDREFWQYDVFNNAMIAKSNYAANVAGMPSDLIGLAIMATAADPHRRQYVLDMMGVDSVWDIPSAVPGNSDQWANWLGGDPDHPSMLATAFAAPGEWLKGTALGVKLGLNAGAKGAAKTADMVVKNERLTRLREFQALDKKGNLPAYDEAAWRQTGWYKGEDGKPRFWISDADAKVSLTQDKMAEWTKGMKPGERKKIPVKLRDVFEHDELYELYPEIGDMRVVMHVFADKNGKIWINEPTKVAQKIQGSMSATKGGVVTKIELFGGRSADSLKRFFLHEVQHVIQTVEGFAGGASSAQMGDEVIGRFVRLAKDREAVKLIDDGVDDVDFLAQELENMGWDEGSIKEILDDENSLVMDYMAAKWSKDDDRLWELGLELDGTVEATKGDLVHLLNYLGINDEEGAMKIAYELGEKLRFTDMGELKHAAYLHAYGEAESRLGEALRNHRSITGPPNPNKLTDVTQPLSVGEVKKPGIVMPAELADKHQGKVITTDSAPVKGVDDPAKGVFGKHIIRARRENRNIEGADSVYYNARRRFWRKDDPDLDENEVMELAAKDVQRRVENRASIAGQLPSGEVNRVKVNVVGKDKTIELLKNPTEAEFNQWSKKAFRDFYRRPDVEEYDEPMVRVVTDVDGNVYVWDADAAMHSDVIKGTGMKYNHEEDWTDVDGIELQHLFDELVKGGVYDEVGKIRTYFGTVSTK